ncbi:MAG: hypothetical protein AAB631_02355 [Patescibacteria group bacterium]
MKDVIFRAYDIRGRYPEELGADDIRKIAGALQTHFGKGKIVLGHDGRKSSPTLYRTLCSCFKASQKIEAGLITTPMLYFLVEDLKTAGGITITASHNPKNINGLKVVGRDAVPISGLEIKKMLHSL